jgi:hypothetical protein
LVHPGNGSSIEATAETSSRRTISVGTGKRFFPPDATRIILAFITTDEAYLSLHRLYF